MMLIVEDNELQRKLLEENFKQKGFKTMSASNGQQALKMMGDFEFSLIISDVNMPKISGFELAKLIRHGEKKRHIPFLLYSSKFPPDDEDLELARNSGVDSYVMKAGVQGIVSEVLDFLRVSE